MSPAIILYLAIGIGGFVLGMILKRAMELLAKIFTVGELVENAETRANSVKTAYEEMYGIVHKAKNEASEMGYAVEQARKIGSIIERVCDLEKKAKQNAYDISIVRERVFHDR